MVRRYRADLEEARAVLAEARSILDGTRARESERRARIVGHTDAEHLSWIEDFARRELLAANDADLDEAAGLVNAFLAARLGSWGGDVNTVIDSDLLRFRVTPDMVQAIQQQVRQVLTTLEPDGFVWFPQPIVDGIRWTGDGVVSLTRAPGLPKVLAAITDVLSAVGPRLRRCETPACRRLFAVTRPHQLRCSAQCAARYRVKKSRDNRKNREQHLEARHEKYAGRVKATAPNVQVERRPRKPKGE